MKFYTNCQAQHHQCRWRERERERERQRYLAEGKISVEVTDVHQRTEMQKRHSEVHRDRGEGTTKKKIARVRTHQC